MSRREVRGPSESDLTKLLTSADWHARGWQRPWSFANADQITVTVIDQSLPEGECSNVENQAKGGEMTNFFAKATLNKPSKFPARTRKTPFFGFCGLLRRPFGPFAGP